MNLHVFKLTFASFILMPRGNEKKKQVYLFEGGRVLLKENSKIQVARPALNDFPKAFMDSN